MRERDGTHPYMGNKSFQTCMYRKTSDFDWSVIVRRVVSIWSKTKREQTKQKSDIKIHPQNYPFVSPSKPLITVCGFRHTAGVAFAFLPPGR